MFNLERSIAAWRKQMLAAGINSPRTLEELESHLREELEHTIQAGLKPQEAFTAALEQLGRVDTLSPEFAKIRTFREVKERKLKRFCIAGAGMAYLTPLALSASKLWQHLSATEWWLGLAAVALTELSLFSGLFLHRALPVISDKRIRLRVQFASLLPLLIWLCVFTYWLLPRVELTLSQITVTTLWAITPLAVVSGLVYGLDEAARREFKAAR